MTRQDIAFSADGATLRGWLYRHDGATGPAPIIIMAPGFTAVKEQHCGHYAEAFAQQGFNVLLFDNRNFGASDGEPRQEADPTQQIEDYKHAISFARTLDGVDGERVGIWGSSYAGGHVLVVAATDRRVKCVVSQVPAIDGWAGALRRIHPSLFSTVTAQYTADREARFAGAAPTTIDIVSNVAGARCALPGEEPWNQFFGTDAQAAPNWVNRVTIRSGELALHYQPGLVIDRISPTPLLMIVANRDTDVPTDLALSAYARALEPKQLLLLKGSHFATYKENFERSCQAACVWFTAHL